MNPRQSQHDEAIEAAAASWLARRDAGLTPKEEAELVRWQAADPRHAAAMAEFETMWTTIGRPRRTGVAAAVQRECGLLQRRRRRRRAALAAGACAVVLLVGLAIPRWGSRETSPTPQTAVLLLPERQTLPDGSVVELKDGAKVTVAFAADGTGPRRVILHSGEAHFQVTKDAARPFVVAAGHVAVRAVGTAFSIDCSQARIDVIVTEGTVAVGETAATSAAPPEAEPSRPASAASGSAPDLASAPREWRIESGNRMVFDEAVKSAPELRPVAATELDQRLAWRSPRVEFSHAGLPEVVRVMNQHNRLQFRIADAELERVTLSGRFRADDAVAFARALERSFGIATERASETEISLRRAR